MRRTKRYGWPYSHAINVPFEVNWDSPQAKGLVAWWPIFDSRGRTTDVLDKLKRFDVAQFNSPAWAASGMFGPTMLFDDGASEYLEIATAIVSSPPFTISAWVCPDAVDAELTIFCLGDSVVHADYWKMVVRGNVVPDPIAFQASSRRAVTTTGVTVNTWHHACGIEYAANSRAAFIDGGSKGTNAVAQAVSPDRTAIGRECDSTPGFYFSGRIADVRIYNRALSDIEVWQLYNPATRWELYRPMWQMPAWRSPAVLRIPRPPAAYNTLAIY